MAETTLSGKVVKKLVANNSKLEREAVVLITAGNKEYVLRQQGGNPHQDPALEDLVGKSIKGDGKILGMIFIMSDWLED